MKIPNVMPRTPNNNVKVQAESSFFDDVKLEILKKATAVKNDHGLLTLGPLATASNSEHDLPQRSSVSAENGCPTTSSHCIPANVCKPVIRRESNDADNKVSSARSAAQKVMKATIDSEPTVTRLLINYEKFRQNEVEEVMKQRFDAMAEIGHELVQKRELIHAELQAQRHAKDLIAQEALLAQLEEEEKRLGERRQLLRQQQEIQAKRVSLRNERLKAAEQKVKEEEEDKKRRTAEKLQRLDEMQQIQHNYRCLYQAILNYLRSSKDKQSFMNHVMNLKTYSEGMEQLIQQCKLGSVSSNDLETASTLLKQLQVISDDVQSKIGEQQSKEEQQQQERKEVKTEGNEQQEEIKKQQAVEPTDGQLKRPCEPAEDARKIGDGLADCVDNRNLQTYLDLMKIQQDVEKSYEELIKNDSLKKYRFECQKAINIPVNAISPVSASHLMDKLSKLSRLLSGQTVVTSDTQRVSASMHPSGIPFCKDLLAKKLVRQGDSTVSSKPEAAFAIAAVIVALWQEFPCWGQLVLAHFYAECPYLVPFFKPQLEGQTTKEYYKSLGYRYSEDGEVEKQDKFLKRMSGFMRLYAAVLITSPSRSRSNKPHPHGLGNGWRWLASVLNLEPRPDICATLIYDFLEVAGRSMYQYYGRQFQKLLVVLCKEYFPLLQKVSGSSSGPVVRLETFLQKILKEGRIESPAGMLRSDF